MSSKTNLFNFIQWVLVNHTNVVLEFMREQDLFFEEEKE